MIDYSRDGEEWRAIDGFENYLISNEGRVLNRSRGNVLAAYQRGYWVPKSVNLTRGGRGHYRYVKRLVAAAFFPDFNPDKHRVTLMDDMEYNCRWDNLSFNDGFTGPYAPGNPTVRIRYVMDRDLNNDGAVTLYRSPYEFIEAEGCDTKSVYDCLNKNGRFSVYGHQLSWIYLESEVGLEWAEPLSIPV